MDYLPPAAAVSAVREPAPPGDSVAKQLFRLADTGALSGLVLGTEAS
ncbi:MAG: hypothetical protein ACREXX_05545 [Gammaproteobacteria bacterium]